MQRRWFGTDGIRGKAGDEPLTVPFLTRLGQVLGEQARADAPAEGPALALLARDTRESGPEIARALAQGMAAEGLRVVDLGVVPTAGMPLAMRQDDAALGLVISASHNPWQDNGVKVFGRGGLKLPDAVEAAVESRLESMGHKPLPLDLPPPRTRDGATAYCEEMLARFGGLDLSGMNLAVDCAHGSASTTAPRVLLELGASITPMAHRPDGRNINEDCGSTHMGTLAARVTADGFDLGLAFDGDADRVLMVDGQGRFCTGDHMLGFLGPWLASRGELPGDTVVATVMSNLGLQRHMGAAGLELLRTPVGDRHVLAAMIEGGFGLGGEDSGHLILPHHGHLLGDGLLTALLVLSGLRETGRDLVSVVDAVAKVPQVLLNVPVASRPPLDELPRVNALVAAAEAAHGDDIRIVLRYSGTEALARVMVEGMDAGVVERTSEELAELWRAEIETHGSGA